MTKIIMLLAVLTSLIQIIKPIGLPGLRRRQDAWKLPVAGAVITFLTIMATATI